MRIGVFCSSQEINATKYVATVSKVIQSLVRMDHTIVWGGSDVGLMRVAADTVERNSGHLIGVSVSFLAHQARSSVKDMVIAKNLGERKQMLLELSDILLVLPGGLGTLDEVLSVLELKKHGKHTKPVIVLNCFDFFGGLKYQLESMARLGFLPIPLDELVHFTSNSRGVTNYIINSYKR